MRSREREGTRTDVAVQPQETECLPRDTYLLVRTPSNPGYRDGNYLIVDTPPMPSKLDVWKAQFRAELPFLPSHRFLIAWETDPGIEWRPSGQDENIEYWRHVVLVISAPEDEAGNDAGNVDPGQPGDIRFAPLSADAHWNQVQVLSQRTNDISAPAYREFLAWRYPHYRRTIAEQGGVWWGAWHGDALVASLGLIQVGAALRFQEVQTDPNHQRRGICTALCRHAIRHGVAHFGADTLVIVAESGSPAERIYRRLGFREVGWQHHVALAASPAVPEKQ